MTCQSLAATAESARLPNRVELRAPKCERLTAHPSVLIRDMCQADTEQIDTGLSAKPRVFVQAYSWSAPRSAT